MLCRAKQCRRDTISIETHNKVLQFTIKNISSYKLNGEESDILSGNNSLLIFDVVSCFTNVPLQESIDISCQSYLSSFGQFVYGVNEKEWLKST